MKKIKKNCNYPGCGILVDKGVSYCKIHSKDHDYKYKTNYWKKTRKAKITNNPLCELCEIKGIIKKAEIVHHLKDAQDFQELFFDIDNLQSLCRSCHKKIHDKQDKNNCGFKVKINGVNIKIK